MSNLKGISEKCADVLKMHEPLVVLDDVVVTVDEEKEMLYIVSKKDGACKAFKLGDSGIKEITGEEQSDDIYLCPIILIKIIYVAMEAKFICFVRILFQKSKFIFLM